MSTAMVEYGRSYTVEALKLPVGFLDVTSIAEALKLPVGLVSRLEASIGLMLHPFSATGSPLLI